MAPLVHVEPTALEEAVPAEPASGGHRRLAPLARAGAAAAALCGVGWCAAALTGAPERGPAPARRLSITDRNVFAEHPFYVNPTYAESLEKSIPTAEPEVAATLEEMKTVPSAYWLDVKAKIKGTDTRSMQGILADAASKEDPELVTFIVYDLPNRDCHAKASNGQICCTYLPDGRCDYFTAGTCEAGLNEYKTEYIDEIVEVLVEYDGKVPIVVVIEPDSLPNLATNMHDPRCGNIATQTAYKEGISYAVKSIGQATSSVAIYLDAGHGGWLGWENNMRKFVGIVEPMGVTPYLRGFATNVAGYQALGEKCAEHDFCLPSKGNSEHPCCYDPCGLTEEWNPAQNEHNYAMSLRKYFQEMVPGFVPYIIVDTGRNGVANERQDCANWCNIRHAGAGTKPTTDTEDPDLIDAYFWLKTPGESDGCTRLLPSGEECPRFDRDCASDDSIGSRGAFGHGVGSFAEEPRAPEAGLWFDFQVKMLARNAHMERHEYAGASIDWSHFSQVEHADAASPLPFLGDQGEFQAKGPR